jgi:hypothetical protein
MKRAFLVLGPESSGTRLLTSLLIAGGCAGDATHFQPFDNRDFGNADPIVWRRSYPWSIRRLWPDLGADLLPRLERGGFTVQRAVVTMRDWYALAKSQVRHNHVSTESAALENIATAYREIFRQLHEHKIAARTVAYEAVTGFQERAVRPLLRELGLNREATLPPIRDESTKYYGA